MCKDTICMTIVAQRRREEMEIYWGKAFVSY